MNDVLDVFEPGTTVLRVEGYSIFQQIRTKTCTSAVSKLQMQKFPRHGVSIVKSA